MTTVTKRSKKQIMYSHVESYQLSGMSIRTYAEKHGLTRSTLAYWAGKKRREETLDDASRESPSFLQLGFADQGASAVSSYPCRTSSESSPQAVLRFPGGLSIEIYA